MFTMFREQLKGDVRDDKKSLSTSALSSMRQHQGITLKPSRVVSGTPRLHSLDMLQSQASLNPVIYVHPSTLTSSQAVPSGLWSVCRCWSVPPK